MHWLEKMASSWEYVNKSFGLQNKTRYIFIYFYIFWQTEWLKVSATGCWIMLANRSFIYFLVLNSFPQTYCCNSQVADCACSATALLCGVKANNGTIGVTCCVNYGNCTAMNNVSSHASSILKWSQVRIFISNTGIFQNFKISIYPIWNLDSHIDRQIVAELVRE